MMKKGIQILSELIKNLKWKVVRIFVAHPLFILPTVWATVESLLLADENFEEESGGNGLANAYRHAVWNMLTALYCSKVSSPEKSVDWAKKITDLHEELFQNQDFDREMDLHNNAVGRTLFMEIKGPKKELLRRLSLKIETAQSLSDVGSFRDYNSELVYYKSKE